MFRTRRCPAARPPRPPRCLPAWSHVQNQTLPRRATSSATTLLASVEPCSEPDAAPLRDLFGHHAACQRGAMFRTRRSPRRATSSATTLLASVEPCSEPELGPPATSSATTLLASVEPCSEPELAPPRDLFGHHAACQRGAMFRTRARPAARPLRPPRCLPAWSHVQNQSSPRRATSSATTLLASVEPCSEPDIAPLTASGILNTAPRWQAAWWRSNGFLGGFISGLEHRSTLASSVVTWARSSRKVAPDAALLISEELGHRELPPKPGSYFGHRCYRQESPRTLALGSRPLGGLPRRAGRKFAGCRCTGIARGACDVGVMASAKQLALPRLRAIAISGHSIDQGSGRRIALGGGGDSGHASSTRCFLSQPGHRFLGYHIDAFPEVRSCRIERQTVNVDGRRKLVGQVAKRVDQVLAEFVDGTERSPADSVQTLNLATFVDVTQAQGANCVWTHRGSDERGVTRRTERSSATSATELPNCRRSRQHVAYLRRLGDTCFCELDGNQTPMATDSTLALPGTGLTPRQQNG